MALHAAALPLLLGLGWPADRAEPAHERVIEVSLAWAPPPAGSQPPAAEPAPPETRRPAAPAAGPAVPAPRPPPRAAVAAPGPTPPQPAPAGAAEPAPAAVPAPTAALPAAALPAAAPPPPDAEMLAGYARALMARLERFKTYPVLSQRRGEEGIVTLRLTLSLDGRLVEAVPVGEGPFRLVEASLAAVRAAQPFPPLPAQLGAAEMVFNLPITYRLN